MQTIELHKISQSEVSELQAISIQTFRETFAALNSEMNMQMYFDEQLSINRLNIELNNLKSEFYFALIDQEIAAYLKLNFGNAQTENQQANSVEIERVYVLKEFQGRRIGQYLLDKAIEIAKEKGADYIWLGVWENNAKAIRFYQKTGFITYGQHAFLLGDDEQIDLLMKLEIA
jgi:diamine N-acetyltransferase